MADEQVGGRASPITTATTMIGYFDRLPPELMLDILGRMKMQELAVLMQCSKGLQAYIEPEVYRHKFVRDIAMTWAIRSSKPGLIRRLVNKYGASPSFYGGSMANDLIDAVPHIWRSLYNRPKLTLLTAMKNHYGADELLRTLIELGACLDPYACVHSQKDIREVNYPEDNMSEILHDQASHFPQRLMRMRTRETSQQEAKLTAFRYYYDTGRDWFIKKRGAAPSILHALPRLIRSDNDLPIIQLILDKEVSESLGYYAQGMSYPPIDKIYFWATPIDVFMDCLSLRYLRQRVRIEDDDFGGDDITYSAHSNMAVFLQNHARADLASKRAPPRVKDKSRAKEDGPEDVSQIYPGEPTDPLLDEWYGWKRVVSPVTLEILLDRITVSGMAHPVASSYAELLKSMFSSGWGQAARLMSKYDGPAPESRFPSWTSGAESVGRRTLAMLLLCDDQSSLQSRELHQYIVYAVRRADMLFMDKVIDNIEQVFSDLASFIDVEGPYVPNLADDDVELQYHYFNRSAAPMINRSQATYPVEGWTALHEICRLWNLQMIAYEKSRIKHSPDYPVPRFARETATTMKLLATLVLHKFPIHQMSDEEMAPYEILLKDPDSDLSKESVMLLQSIGQYMKTARLVDLLAVKK
ncbi:hypothetical protein Sste5346_008594 [Sporothrix stenoceras]|uniref:F-box domain-containing protein n=1 Tax=Sporothrix stenoceras TaxID=5173 RepID=A0ABR3YNC8_9PEZI